MFNNLLNLKKENYKSFDEDYYLYDLSNNKGLIVINAYNETNIQTSLIYFFFKSGVLILDVIQETDTTLFSVSVDEDINLKITKLLSCDFCINIMEF